jgi:uracil-DNA glycosylase
MLETKASVQPLREWAATLAHERNALVPQFDPSEAGTMATVLILFEAPGPMTNADGLRPGSGFISVDNNDATAENLWRARTDARLIEGVLCWNIVPWYLGVASRKPTTAELKEGGAALQSLLALLPDLHTVVASGRYAQRGWREFARPGSSIAVRTIETWHPSPLSMNQPGHRDDLTAALKRAREDWRAVPHEGSIDLTIDRDKAGCPIAGWYLDEARDRIDAHPRWWDSPFSSL